MPTVTLKVTDLEAFNERMEKLNKKLAKKGLEAAGVLNMDQKFGEDVVSDADVALLMSLHGQAVVTRKLYFEVSVNLPVAFLGLPDVTWVGKQEAVSGGRKIVALDKNIDLEPFRKQEMTCDHCGWARNRKTTYFFQKDGEVLQIGSTCVNEYFGMDLLFLLEEFSAFCTSASSESDGYRTDQVNPAWFRIYMTTAAYYIATEGFKGKRYEEESTDSKACRMASILTERSSYYPPTQSEIETRQRYQKAFAEYKEMLEKNDLQTVVEDAQNYWLAWDKPDTFLQNCKTAILGTSYKMRGFFASAMKEYLSTITKAATPAPKDHISEEFLGAIGDKLEVTGTVLQCQSYDNGFATSWKLVVRSLDNHRICWWASSCPNVIAGNLITLIGKIKKHEEYQTRKTTVLTRCKLAVVKV